MNTQTQPLMLELVRVWSNFSSLLDTVPIIDKLQRGKFRVEDYRHLLLNQRQQVIEGSRWIARAASSVDGSYADQRSVFLRHAVTEHRDYRMLEADYCSVGGALDDIRSAEKNVGTEALHAFLYQRAGEPNPFELLGALFIIEGLGQKKAGEWGELIREQLGLDPSQVSFLLYHSRNDEDHLREFEEVLGSGILQIEGMPRKIVKTASVVARLYQLQLEELNNFG